MVSQQLMDLKRAVDEASCDQLAQIVQTALKSKSSLLIEQAAILVRDRQLAIDPELMIAAYDRLLVRPEQTNLPIEDKNCRAKLPLVEALHALEFDDPDFYSAGLKYRQVEPAWPADEETAGNLRGAHAYALVSSRWASRDETLMKLVDLLFDSQKVARVHAAAAIGQMGHPGSAALMKATLRQASDDVEVLGECLRSLLRNDGGSMEFVKNYLHHEDLCIEAAAALTEFGGDEGVKAVIEHARLSTGTFQEALFLTLGVSRQSLSLDFLIQCVQQETFATAKAAIKALAPNRFYPDISRRVQEAVAASDHHELKELFQIVFEEGLETD